MRSPLCSAENQELGVEEPAGVLDERNEPGSDVGADRLEAALGVGGESGTQGSAEQHVVPAGDELPLRAPPTTREPRAESGNRSPRSECPEINGATRGSSPARSVERSTSMYARTAASEADQAARSARPRPFSSRWTTRTCGKLAGESRCDRSGAVSAGVVGNGDPREVRDVSSEIVVQPPYAMLQVGFLVVDRDDNLEHRHIGALVQLEGPVTPAGGSRSLRGGSSMSAALIAWSLRGGSLMSRLLMPWALMSWALMSRSLMSWAEAQVRCCTRRVLPLC